MCASVLLSMLGGGAAIIPTLNGVCSCQCLEVVQPLSPPCNLCVCMRAHARVCACAHVCVLMSILGGTGGLSWDNKRKALAFLTEVPSRTKSKCLLLIGFIYI